MRGKRRPPFPSNKVRNNGSLRHSPSTAATLDDITTGIKDKMTRNPESQVCLMERFGPLARRGASEGEGGKEWGRLECGGDRERKRRKEGEVESRNVRIASVSSFSFVKTPILMCNLEL